MLARIAISMLTEPENAAHAEPPANATRVRVVVGAPWVVRSEGGRIRTPRRSVTGGNAASLPIEARPGGRWSQFIMRSGDHKMHVIPGQIVVRGRIELPTFRFSE